MREDFFLSRLVLWAVKKEILSMGGDQVNDFVLSKKNGDTFTVATSEALCLHFDGLNIQSLMSFREPYKLYLSYTQAMMGFKLFKPHPRHILIVGLGGGSLSKYCHKRFPKARTTTLEISEDVLALRKEFHIPDDCDRFKVIKTDAAIYMPNQHKVADVLLLDGFTSDGLPDSLCSLQFYNDCYYALDDDGLLVANLHREDLRFNTHLSRISSVFDGNCLIGYAENCGNYIVIASKSGGRLLDDVQIDIRRLVVKTKKNLAIPHFETFENFLKNDSFAEKFS
jgi:spermidine synthase